MGKNDAKNAKAMTAAWPYTAAIPAKIDRTTKNSAVTTFKFSNVKPAEGTQSVYAQALASAAAQTTPSARPSQSMLFLIRS